MSKYPDIFADLIAPFAKDEVKTRPQGGRQLSYVTARTVMNRLDDVLGPENWWDEYHPQENSVLCRLSIKLPDGSVLTKCDAGGYAGMTDSGDDDKSGYSDAFKRAAVKFGVGRYLYRDGVPSFKTKPAVPFREWVKATCEEINCKWVDDLTRRFGSIPAKAPAEVINPFKLGKHLLKWAKGGNLIPPASTTLDAIWAIPAAEAGIAAEALEYCRKEWLAAKGKVKPPREPGDDGDDVDDVLDKMAEEGAVT